MAKGATDPLAVLVWEVCDVVPAEAARIVDQGLGDANAAAAPVRDVTALACFARLPSGLVVGGAVGRTWGRCCELQQLWVDAGHRGRGIGSQLVRRFESHAAGRGCSVYYLETFSFQAPEFYRSLGYRPAVVLRGFPQGIAKYLMVRGVPDPPGEV